MTPVLQTPTAGSACAPCAGCVCAHGKIAAARARGSSPRSGCGVAQPRGITDGCAVDDPTGPPAAASDWQRVGATVDRSDTIPGPFGRTLERLGNAQNPFARIDGPLIADLEPGARAIFSAVVAAPTALSSALALEGASGQAELRVDWTETPPGYVLADRRAGLVASAGAVEALGFGAWRLALEARNDAAEAIAVRPSLHVASGIGNAGLAVGLYAGLLRVGRAGAARAGTGQTVDR